MRLIDADAAIDALNEQIEQCNKALGSFDILPKDEYAIKVERASLKAYKEQLENMPSAEPDTTTHDSIPAETGKNDGDRTSGDCVNRQAALETIRTLQTYKLFAGDDMILIDKAQVQTELMMLPPVQPEIIRCKDCKHSRFFDPCFYCYEMGGEIIVPENGFCFKAERKINATD